MKLIPAILLLVIGILIGRSCADVNLGNKVYSVNMDTNKLALMTMPKGDTLYVPIPKVDSREMTIVESVQKNIQKRKVENSWTRTWNAIKDFVSVSWTFLTKVILKLA